MNIVTLLLPIIGVLALAVVSGFIKVGTFNIIFVAAIAILILFSITQKILNSDEAKSFLQPPEQEEEKQEEKQTEDSVLQATQDSQSTSKDSITWGQN